MPSPFEHVSSITNTKTHMISNEIEEKEYIPFIVNRALSNFPDTIFYANEINQLGHLDKKMQYDYLFNSIPKKKRYSKWNKKKSNDDIELIMDYYKYSIEKAQSVLPLLNSDQLDIIRKTLEQGGVQNGKRTK